MRLMMFSPVGFAVIWRWASRKTIYNLVSMIITFEPQIWHIGLFRLSAIRYEYGRPLSASNASSNVVLRRRKGFSRNWCPLSPRLVIRQRPSGPPLTASPVYVCIYSPFRPTPRWEVSTDLQLCFQWIRGRNSSTNSIFIGSPSIDHFSRHLGVEFVFPASRYPRKARYRRAWFPLVPSRPMGFRRFSRVLDPEFVFSASSSPSSIQTSHG